MSDYSDIVAAMGQVKDMDIDVTTGRAVIKSNQSILEKTGVHFGGEIQKKIDISVEKKNQIIKEEKNINESYRQVLGLKPLTLNEEIITEKEVVKPLDLSDDYMAQMVKAVNRG